MGKQLSLFDLPELWMEVKDLDFFRDKIDDSPYTRRELAALVGWKSHAYLNKLYKGEAKTLKPEPAVRMARFLGERVDHLFVTKVSDVPAHNASGQPTPRRRKGDKAA
jgi:hypothetical protein